jgi:hypothetical protein
MVFALPLYKSFTDGSGNAGRISGDGILYSLRKVFCKNNIRYHQSAPGLEHTKSIPKNMLFGRREVDDAGSFFFFSSSISY